MVIIYRMARYLVRALFWLTLGLIFGSVISVFGLIGYLGCLYYLLQALRILQGVPEGTDTSSRISEVEAQIALLINAK